MRRETRPQLFRRTLRKASLRAGAGLLCLLAIGACTTPQIARIGCLDACHAKQERCIADARDDYRQCQAGYDSTFRAYRWCLASASEQEECGYPWWSCAENRYGYCANRHSDCTRACRGAEPVPKG